MLVTNTAVRPIHATTTNAALLEFNLDTGGVLSHKHSDVESFRNIYHSKGEQREGRKLPKIGCVKFI